MKFADKKSLILLLPKILSSLFLVLVASFLFIAIITFSTFDPGWTYVASDTQQVSNLTGIVGAWFANVLRAFFGLASIWFPIILAYEAYQLWHAKKIITRLLRHFSQLFLILSSATLLALLRPSNTYTLDASGGILGYETAVAFSSLNLPSYLVMAIIFVFVLLFLSVAFAIQWSNAKNFFHQLRYNYHNIFYKYQSDAILIRENQKAQQRLAALQKQKTHSKQAEQTQMTIDEHVNHAAHSPDTVKINAENVYVSGDVWHQSSDGQASLQEMKQMLQELKQHSHAQRAEQNQVNTTTNTTNTTTETNTASKNQLNWSDDAAFDDLLQSAQQQSQAPTIHHTAFEQKHQQMSHRAAQATQLNQQIQQLNQQNQATQPSITESQTPTTKSIAPTQTTTSNKSVADLIHERLNQPSPLENVDQFLQQSEIQSDTTSQQPSHNDIKIVEPSIPAPTQNTVQNQQDDDFPGQQNHHSPTPLLYRNAVANPVAELQSDDLSNDDFNHDWHDDLDHQTTNVMPTSHSTHSTPQAVLHTPSQHNSTSHDFDLNHANDDVDSNTNSVMNETAQQDDDWDAPLTDSSGRIISRAMQVAEHRKTLSPLPSLDLLDPVDLTQKVQISEQELKQRAELLEIKLQDFNIKASVKEIHPGPVITRFELELAPGMKSSKVANIAQDLARSMAVGSLRVVQVIAGKSYIGIEIPNKKRSMVKLIEILQEDAFKDPSIALSMAMGVNIAGQPILADLAKAPHMLVAGTTGSGKSVAVNSMLLTMLMKYTPEQLRLLLIDPKQLEFANYDDIPHLLTPVISDMEKATNALAWCVKEMERRYQLMALFKVRKLEEFNPKIQAAIDRGEPEIDPLWKPDQSATQTRAPRLKPLPRIVIVADEFADMIMQLGKKPEILITRIAQKARAAGIHLLIATQRPTADVVTGLIKSNIPTRVGLRVSSKVDSRIILDAAGAEDLLGHGDMLYLGPGQKEPERLHGAFISDDEVNRVCDAWRERGSPDYVDDILDDVDEEGVSSRPTASSEDVGDPLYDDAVQFVLTTRKASASALQRKFSIGYNRAGKLIDLMEENGLIGPSVSSGRREVLG